MHVSELQALGGEREGRGSHCAASFSATCGHVQQQVCAQHTAALQKVRGGGGTCLGGVCRRQHGGHVSAHLSPPASHWSWSTPGELIHSQLWPLLLAPGWPFRSQFHMRRLLHVCRCGAGQRCACRCGAGHRCACRCGGARAGAGPGTGACPPGGRGGGPNHGHGLRAHTLLSFLPWFFLGT